MAEVLKMLAFDLGASSGRAILGILDGDKLSLKEVHRFSNDPVEVRGSLHWDILRLFYEIKQGILKCVNSGNGDIASIAVDTWGVDFGLLDQKGNLLGNPYHYRDKNTDNMMQEVFKLIPEDELYRKTGIQLMKINTIFQLYSMKLRNLPAFGQTSTVLLTPDLLNYFLTGVRAAEYSIASTTQLLDPIKRTWSEEIIKRLGLPGYILPDIVFPGSIIGKLSADIARELGINEIPVVAAASHDTQSAVVSVPAEGDEFVYISCGTWSLMGVETDQPIISEKSNRMAFTNEGGVGGKITFQKNIMGLWLVQECKRQWEKEGCHLSYAELGELALQAKPFPCFIDPDHEMFIAPGDMPAKIKAFCADTGQHVPESKSEIVRTVMQSLAMKYRTTMEDLEDVLGKRFDTIHMLGGGIQDRLLCQFTAAATGRRVIAGPVEATSIGNLLVQAMALGKVGSLPEMRQIARLSFERTFYEPENPDIWDMAYQQYCKSINLDRG